MPQSLGASFDRGGNERRQAGFHIAAAAAVYLAVRDSAAERLGAPGRGAQRHHIRMPRKGERQFLSGSANPRNEIVPAGTHLEVLRLKPGLLQNAAEMPGAGRLVSWRIDGVETDQLLGQLDRRDHGGVEGL